MVSIEAVLAGKARWCVLHADVLDALRSIPSDSFDALLSDVPYGLGTREPTADEIIAYLQGAELSPQKDFMGKRWNVPSVAVWREVSRVLKPGAHLAVFGGTRTYDLISLGLRAAGFKMRDAIEVFHWCYSTGFPKSLDVSKAIDKEAGAAPTVIGKRVLTGTAALSCKERGGTHSVNVSGAGRSREVDITAPTTPEAKRWHGWGTALSPSHEPVMLFRKPLDGTVAHNVLTHGTGGLNIDACRTYTNWEDRSEAWKRSGHTGKPDADKIAAHPGTGINCHPCGRWPANVAFVHHPECVRRGEKTVGAYDCHPDCHVRRLGEQSGETSSGIMAAGTHREGIGYNGGLGNTVLNDTFGDTGTAARFFPTFEPDREPAHFYCAKASRAERDIGCESMPPRKRTEITGRDEDSAGQNNPRAGSRSTADIRNPHVCVKPIQLTRWLARLITPPGGKVLVPYCGSGSEMIGCVLEGASCVGIELDSDNDGFCEIAETRLRWWAEHPGGLTAEAKDEAVLEKHGQQSLFAVSEDRCAKQERVARHPGSRDVRK